MTKRVETFTDEFVCRVSKDFGDSAKRAREELIKTLPLCSVELTLVHSGRCESQS